MGSRPTIRAVAFEHGDHWVAQCLEHDIATQARTLDSLLDELERILAAYILDADGGPAAAPAQVGVSWGTSGDPSIRADPAGREGLTSRRGSGDYVGPVSVLVAP
jgi:hypothetical protein